MLLDPAIYEETGDPAAATLDYVGGRDDLAAQILRAIGDPALRFAEDKLRMLRAVRFAARLDLEIEPRTLAAMRATPPHRSRRSAANASATNSPSCSPKAMPAAPSNCSIRPACSCRFCPKQRRCTASSSRRSSTPKATSGSTRMLLLEKLPPDASPTLAWGALLHDIGKPATFRPPDPKNPDDRIRFNGHVEVGVRIAETILNRLRFSNEDTAQIVALVKNHMRFGDVLQMRESTLKRFLRLPKFDEHLALHWMDASSAHGDLRTLRLRQDSDYEAAPRRGDPASRCS